MEELTNKQREILEVIKVNIWEKGRPPTLRELAKVFGKSHTDMWDSVKALQRKGYIDKEPHKARGIIVTGKG